MYTSFAMFGTYVQKIPINNFQVWDIFNSVARNKSVLTIEILSESIVHNAHFHNALPAHGDLFRFTRLHSKVVKKIVIS